MDDRTYRQRAVDERGNLIQGIEGNSTRLTAEAEWKRSFITDGGLVVTPLLAFQGDTTYVNQSDYSLAALDAMAAQPATAAGVDRQVGLLSRDADRGHGSALAGPVRQHQLLACA